MYPIVYNGSNGSAGPGSYGNLGYGPLVDCISCHVVEERNGPFWLELEYPVGGVIWDKLVPGRLLMAVPSYGANEQLFRVDSVKPSLSGRMAVSAKHISYQMDWAVVEPFSTSAYAQEAMGEITSHIKGSFPFTLTAPTGAQYSSYENFTIKTPRTVRECLMNKEGSMTDVYGGEYVYRDLGYTIALTNNRGSTKTVGVRYGINMINMDLEKALAETYNAVYGYYYDEETGTFVSPGSVQSIGSYSGVGTTRTKIVDFTQSFNAVPTAAQLRTKALAYARANGLTDPQVSVKVDFVPLWQTTEITNPVYAETISLCDTIPIVYERYGIEVTAKVVKTDFDVLKERYRSIEVGTKKTTLPEFLKGVSGKTGVSVWT